MRTCWGSQRHIKETGLWQGSPQGGLHTHCPVNQCHLASLFSILPLAVFYLTVVCSSGMRLLRDACFTPAQGLARQTPGIHSRSLTQRPEPWPWGAEQSHLKITSYFNTIRGYGPDFLTSCFYLQAMKCNSSPFWFKYHHKSQWDGTGSK